MKHWALNFKQFRHSERSEESSCFPPRHSERSEESRLSSFILPWTLVSSTRVTSRESYMTQKATQESDHRKKDATTHRHCESITNRQSNPSFTQSGRSMIEMLGVLAVVAVLTIGGITGYNYAVNKYKSNTIMKDLELRAVALSAQIERMMPPLTPGLELSNDAPKTNPLGQSVTQFISANNVDYFEIEVQKVTQKTCVQTVKDYPSASLIFVNEVSFKGNTDVCTEGDNVMTFVFPKNLGGRPPCSDKGFFDESSYACKCSGNTYFNPETNDCACPAGYVWSNTGRTCIYSVCPEGQFETQTSGCVPCDDLASYVINNSANAQNLCAACPNRYYTPQNYCILKECEPGVSVPKEKGGGCYACDNSSLALNMNSSAYVQEMCNACPNRKYARGLCIKNPPCPVGQFFVRRANSTGAAPACLSCNDTTTDIASYGDSLFAESCSTCRNDAGQPNRTFKNGQCRKTLCDSGEFKGKDGICYSCNEPKSVAVNTESGCTDTACGRQEVNGMCQMNQCNAPDFVRLPNGGCFRCDDKIPFAADQKTCETSCSQRRWLSNGQCMLNTCVKGGSYPWAGPSILCYPCSGREDGSGSTGTSDWSKEYCEACPNGNYVADGYCFNGNSCKRGLEFRKNSSGDYKFCTSCNLASAVYITDHPKHRDMCGACASSKRFYVGKYCYRCDSGEMPVVTSFDEIEACNACGVREIVNNKCVLKQ